MLLTVQQLVFDAFLEQKTRNFFATRTRNIRVKDDGDGFAIDFGELDYALVDELESTEEGGAARRILTIIVKVVRGAGGALCHRLFLLLSRTCGALHELLVIN